MYLEIRLLQWISLNRCFDDQLRISFRHKHLMSFETKKEKKNILWLIVCVDRGLRWPHITMKNVLKVCNRDFNIFQNVLVMRHAHASVCELSALSIIGRITSWSHIVIRVCVYAKQNWMCRIYTDSFQWIPIKIHCCWLNRTCLSANTTSAFGRSRTKYTCFV